MKAVIIGATGATGRSLTEQLLKDASVTEVTVLVRRRYFPPQNKLREIVVHFDEIENFSGEITADIAFSCLGTTLKLAGSKEVQWKVDFDYQHRFARIIAKNNISTFFLLSSLGANENSKFFYSRMKGALETAIIKSEFPRLVIFRPGPLIRPNTDRLGEKLSIPAIRLLNAAGILRQYRPVLVDDLARAMIKKSKMNLERVEIVSPGEIFRLVH